MGDRLELSAPMITVIQHPRTPLIDPNLRIALEQSNNQSTTSFEVRATIKRNSFRFSSDGTLVSATAFVIYYFVC